MMYHTLHWFAGERIASSAKGNFNSKLRMPPMAGINISNMNLKKYITGTWKSAAADL